ncbi:MAG: hypothetical protein DLM54_06110 [Acidimicrobiales bacterium]|nr:MAG: hypothetical protein DLM54_06110 [Acidimicrobiales bacterium]
MTGRGAPLIDEVRAAAFTVPTDRPESDPTADQERVAAARAAIGYDVTYFARMLAAGAVDVLQADAKPPASSTGATAWSASNGPG